MQLHHVPSGQIVRIARTDISGVVARGQIIFSAPRPEGIDHLTPIPVFICPPDMVMLFQTGGPDQSQYKIWLLDEWTAVELDSGTDRHLCQSMARPV